MNAGLNNVLNIERMARHFLVLSQDVDFAQGLEATLRKEDYQATIVRSPRQAALTVLNQKDIDAIICDAGNLGRDEERMFHQMRQNLDAFSIPMLMLLDPKDEAQWQLVDKLATDEFVIKPTQEEELLLRLKGLLWRKEISPARTTDHQWPELLQGFIRYVKSDLESKFEVGGSASLTLIETTGAWEAMVAGDDSCDPLTDQLFDYLTTSLRRIDRVVRYGRVTLMVYMPGRSEALAREALELLRAEFSQQTGLSFCVGLAGFPDDGASFSELVLAADQSLTLARARASRKLADRTNGTEDGADAYKILIADDDPFLVALLQATFKALGYQSIVADNGRSAIELIHREQPDLVILDNLMPQLSGFEMLEQLRSFYGGRLPVPVIMLTIMTAQSDIIRGYELGVEDYIGKPFNPRELVARVERVLSSQPSFLRAAS